MKSVLSDDSGKKSRHMMTVKLGVDATNHFARQISMQRCLAAHNGYHPLPNAKGLLPCAAR